MKQLTNKHLIILVVSIIAITIIVIAVSVINNAQKTATIVIKYAPKSATAYIDDKRVGETTKIRPGEYNIKLQRDGFDNYEEKVVVAGDDTYTIYIALDPNTSETANWYEQNRADYELREQVLSSQLNDLSENMEQTFPIASDLPFVGTKRIFRIDYGIGSDSKTQAVYITYYTEDAKQMALDWIKEKGYDINDYEVIYIPRDIEEL